MLLFLGSIYLILPVITVVVHYISLLGGYPSAMVWNIVRGTIPGVFLYYFFMNDSYAKTPTL